MAKFKKVLKFEGGLAPVPLPDKSAPVRPVNVDWASRNPMLPDGVALDTGVKAKHHKTAEQRARQLQKTEYKKGPSLSPPSGTKQAKKK